MLDSYTNGGGRPPNHGMVDYKHVAEMREEANKDKNTDKPDADRRDV